MKRVHWICGCITLLLIAVGTGCATEPQIRARFASGEVGGDGVSSQVDSEIARYFLEDYLRGNRVNPQWDAQIEGLLTEASRQPLTAEVLKAVADQTSVDFSAMLFAQIETTRNSASKAIFIEQYRLVQRGKVDLRAATQRYKVVLIPGLFYRSNPETKADLREVQVTLQEAGFDVVSIPILEAGPVEVNARIIADFIQREPANDKAFILVSTSKGGGDTFYALGRLMDPATASKVAIWFSVGGLLRGTALADKWLPWPNRWIISIVGAFAGFTLEGVRSISVPASLKRMEESRIPPHVCVVHFIGVPLSGTVIGAAKGNYEALRRYGPNDGLTLLTDEILPGSTVITALGLDHYYQDPDLRRKMLALVSTVTQAQELQRCRASMSAAAGA
jgi:hypothetical protein